VFERMSFEQFERQAAGGGHVAAFRHVAADLLTPVAAFGALARPGGGAFLLESSDGAGDVGRYSFLGFEPSLRVVGAGRRVEVWRAGERTHVEGDVLAVLRRELARRRVAADAGLPPLVGGAVGTLAYDAVRLWERLPDRHAADAAAPDVDFSFFDIVVAFDHLRRTATISHVVEPGGSPREAFDRAQDRLDEVAARLAAPPGQPPAAGGGPAGAVESDLDDATYERLVRRAKEYILAGDIFQVVLSRRFRMPCPAAPFAVYRALRMVNPSPFMFYLQQGERAVAGSSPERLVRTQGRRVETMPIAGTRPRGAGAEDARLEAELLADPKERAEHMMLVDLARNDLGIVADSGSVVVEELAAVQRLSRVMHLTSRVAATLRQDCDGLDALRAALPAGTLSGAPKIRAMEIIDELETSRRGLYGGAVGYLDGSGQTDSCIAIRMAEIAGGAATVRAGAGIVHDSDPAAEAAETRHKARAVLEAVRLAVEGL